MEVFMLINSDTIFSMTQANQNFSQVARTVDKSGEAVIFTKNNTPKQFVTMTKQRGAMLAKGRLLGLQFDALFTDGLYFKLAGHADRMADRIRATLKDLNVPLLVENTTNQIFPILPDTVLEQLSVEFTNDGSDKEQYDNIKKVYSIWICMDCPENKKDSIINYSFEPHIIYQGNDKLKLYKNCDLMNITFIHLSGKPDQSHHQLISMLDTLLAKMDAMKYFKIHIIAALVCMVPLFFVQKEMPILVFIGLLGYTCSSIFSVIFSMAMRLRPDKANEISGLMITGIVGGAIVPPVMTSATSLFGGSQNGALSVLCLVIAYLIFLSFRIKEKR